MASKYALPHLSKSSHAHILNLSPPLLMVPKWFNQHVAYTMAKVTTKYCDSKSRGSKSLKYVV